MFEVSTDVRQGCPLSPIPFNFAVNWILRNVLSGATEVQHSATFGLTNLTYADDIAFHGDSFVAVQEALNVVDRLTAVSVVVVVVVVAAGA